MPVLPEIIIEEVEPQHVHLGEEVVLYNGLPSEDMVFDVHEEVSPEEFAHEYELLSQEPSDGFYELDESDEDSDEDSDDSEEFELPRYPGAPDEVQDNLEVDDDQVEIEPEMPKSIWDVEKYPSLDVWLRERCAEGNIPPHKAGQDADDLHKVRRTISYLKKVLKHAADMVAGDFDKKIDLDLVGPMLTKIEDSIDRLNDLESDLESKKKSRKKKASLDSLVKEGQKATHVGGIIITVPLLISKIARTCIHAVVTHGKDLVKTYEEQVKKYALDEREQAEVQQLLADMAYPLPQTLDQ